MTPGEVVAKADAAKVHKLDQGGPNGAGVLVGFSGAAAHAFALLEGFETHLKVSPQNIKKAAVNTPQPHADPQASRLLAPLFRLNCPL